jgi:uncharacterized protein YqgV (UPF0045/DUF77 family)
MPVFFGFSDESGKYKKERSDKFISKNPFYCRSAVILEAHDWMKLSEKFYHLKENFLKVSRLQTVKWSYIWSLYKHFQKKEAIPSNKPYFTLRNHSLDKLIEFIRKILQLLCECQSCRIILTLTFNDRQKTEPLEFKNIAKFHLSHIFNMAEKEMLKIPESVCIFFMSREEPALERIIKEAFCEIHRESPPQQYARIKNSLNFEYFPQSFGGQVADYCAGAFNGCLRLYPQSIDLFRHQIWPKIMQEKNKVLGHGLTELPRDSKNRTYLKNILERVFAADERAYRVSLEERLKSEPL